MLPPGAGSLTSLGHQRPKSHAARLTVSVGTGHLLPSQTITTAAVEEAMPLEEIGEVTLKGLTQPVAVYNVPPPGGQAAKLGSKST